MPSAAYPRARHLLDERPGAVTTARALGVFHALLILALAGVGALLAELIVSRGEARVAPEVAKGMPPWLAQRVSGKDRDTVLVDDAGLIPVITDNVQSTNAVHRVGAWAIIYLTRAVPTLRNNVGALTTLIAVALILALMLSLVAAWRRRVLAEATSQVAASLRKQIHRQMYRLGQSALPTEGVGNVINLFTREVNDIREGLFSELDTRPRVPILAAGLLVFALVVSPFATLFLASLGGLVWLAARALTSSRRLGLQSSSRDAALQLALLQEDLGLLRMIRVFGMENVDKQRFDEHLERFRVAEATRIRAEGRLDPAMGLLASMSAAMVIGLLGYNVVRDYDAPVTALALFGALIGLAYPASEWLSARSAARRAARSADGLFGFFDRKPELQQAVGAHFLPPLKDRIAFENVTIKSVSGQVLLEGLSAEIPARSRTSILSLDEDAKHALVCLIPRLIDPAVGRVRLDGLDLRDVTLESIRAQIAIVLQADLIFSDTVLANIGLGDPSFPLPRIMEAAKVAHAHGFIQEMPQGYDTPIGPLGHYLPVDQQYRIALARAYLHDPSIVIVEEPLSPLEDDVKSLIDDTMARLSPGRTMITLPHRLSTIRNSDRVLILHNGRLEASGSPRDLHDQSKLFRHIQYVEFNQFATGEIEAGQMGA